MNLFKAFAYFILVGCATLVQAQAYRDKAIALFDQSQFNQARPLFEQWNAEAPNNLFVIEHLGDIEGHSSHWDKCIEYYDKLVRLKPTEANYYYKKGGAMGMKAKDGGKWAAIRLIHPMRDCFERAIQLNPKHIEARWGLIEYYLQLPGFIGGSERKAQHFADELLKISPVDGYLAKGHIDEYFERYQKAAQQYRKAIEVGGSKTTYDRLAYLYKFKLHQPERAREVLDAYLRKTGKTM
ncbi:MAG: hypothetical protein CFE24_11290 [Flavobacterium sp. BFFFF2]|nr:MAG: hypothetical protein CFE24_11290 [Flavobacterium sp. BFFFF2]